MAAGFVAILAVELHFLDPLQGTCHIRSLAELVISGELDLHALPEDNEEAIALLTKIKGIGRWSAEIFLLFHLGRPDVISGGDLGIRKAIMVEYGFTNLPTDAAKDIRHVTNRYLRGE